MTLHVFDDSRQGAGFTLTLVFSPICILCTILRFLATKRAGRNFAWDDWFALLALLSFLPYVAYMLLIFISVNGRDLFIYIKTEPKSWAEVAKVGLIVNGIYGVQQRFAKFSLLALYHRLFSVKRAFVRVVWIIAGIQAAWGLSVLFVHVFSCVPVEKAWIPTLEGHCVNINTFFSITEPINSTIDFIVAALTIWMLSSLQMKRLRRWRLIILFIVGGFSGVVGIVKTVEAQQNAKRNFLSIIWNLAQMATSIICCCAPIYQSLVPRSGFYYSLRSWASHIFTKKSSVGWIDPSASKISSVSCQGQLNN